MTNSNTNSILAGCFTLKAKLCLLLFLIFSASAYGQEHKFDLGNGRISVNQYAFAPGVKAPDFVTDTLDQSLFNKYIYFVSKNKALRNDLADQSLQKSKNSSVQDGNVAINVNTQLVHPEYILDLDKNLAYLYSRSKSFLTIKSMDDFPVEPFYRSFIKSNNAVYDLSSSADTVIIANQKCFKGTAVAGKDKFVFYYTKDKIGIVSPLNAYVSKDFSYNILLISSEASWTLPDGKLGVGHVIFQICDIHPGKISDDLFDVPPGVPIKKDVSLSELYTN